MLPPAAFPGKVRGFPINDSDNTENVVKNASIKGLLVVIALLLTVNLFSLNASQAQAMPGDQPSHGKCIAIDATQVPGHGCLYRLFEDGTVEGMRILTKDLSVNTWTPLPTPAPSTTRPWQSATPPGCSSPSPGSSSRDLPPTHPSTASAPRKP